MIVGTGLDLVELERMAAFRQRWREKGLRRLFTDAELETCLERVGSTASLAARFAAKEAFFKALGTGYGRGGAWTDVEIQNDAVGAPSLRLHGHAAELARQKGVVRSHVSLTHTGRAAAAVVTLESD